MYQIFISFKKLVPGTDALTKEYYMAQELFEHLEKIGYKDRVFFSEEKLQETGSGNFREEIDKALEEAKILIFISDTPKYLNCNWVKHEWGSFSNELLSSRKKGMIYGLVSKGIKTEEMPYSLRQCQLFKYKDEFELLDSYLEAALTSEDNRFEAGWNAQKRNAHFDLSNFAYVRNDFSKFVDNEFFINYFSLFKVVYNSKNSLIMCMLNKIKEIDTEERNVFYLDNTSELGEIKNNLEFKDITNPEIFIASVDAHEDLAVLYSFLREYPKSKILIGVNEQNKTILNDPELIKVPTYYFNSLNYEETREFAEFFTKTTGYRIPSKFLFYLLSDALEDLRTPVLLRLIFSSIVDTSNYLETDYNITDIFDSIDKSIAKEDHAAIIQILSSMRAKRRNLILKTEIDYDFTKLEKSGVFSENNMVISFSSNIYFNYKIAELIINENGYSVNLEAFENLEKALPYYIYLYYLEFHRLPLVEDVPEEDKDTIIDLLFSEKEAIDQLLKIDSYRSHWIPFIQKALKNDLRMTAGKAIEYLESAGIESTSSFDYLSEKLRLHYTNTGELLDLDYDQGNINYYRAYVLYCKDDYERCLPLYEKSYQEMLFSGQVNTSLLLDYCEPLMDLGKSDKLNEILSLIEECVDFNDPSFEIEKYYRIKCAVATDALQFAEAEDYAIKCITHCGRNGNHNMVSVCYGELGCIKMYQGDYDEAIRYLNINFNLSCRQRNLNGMAISAKLIGKIYFLKKEYKTAYRYFSFAETNAQEASNLWRLAKIRMYLKILSKHGDLIENYDDIENKIPSPVFMYDFELLKACIELSKNNQKGYQHYLLLAKQKADETNNLRAKQRMEYYLGLSNPNEEIKKYTIDFIEAVKGIINHKIESFPLEYYRYDTLKTERLLLRRITYNDAQDIFEYTSNPLNTRFVFWKRHKSLSDTYSYIAYQQSIDTVGYLYTWGIVLDGKLIGTVDLTFNEDYQEVEIGYIINMKYWHKGYAKEAALTVINFLKKMSIKKIVGVCFTANEASKHLLESLGFKLIKKIENYHTRSTVQDKSGLYYELYLK